MTHTMQTALNTIRIALYLLGGGASLWLILMLASRSRQWQRAKRRAGQQVPRMDFPPLPPPVSVPWEGFKLQSYEQYNAAVRRYQWMPQFERDGTAGAICRKLIGHWRKTYLDSQDPAHPSYPGWRWSADPSQPSDNPTTPSTMDRDTKQIVFTATLGARWECFNNSGRHHRAVFHQVTPASADGKTSPLDRVTWMGQASDNNTPGKVSVSGLPEELWQGLGLEPGQYTITITKNA